MKNNDEILIELGNYLWEKKIKKFWKNLHKLSNINYKFKRTYNINDKIYAENTNLLSFITTYDVLYELLEKFENLHINHQDNYGDTILHDLIDKKIYNIKIFQLLIDYGLDINIKNYENKNVLDCLLEKDESNYKIINCLLENGIEITDVSLFLAFEKLDGTLLDYIFKYCTRKHMNIIDENGTSLLTCAIIQDEDCGRYKKLFNYKLDINYQDSIGNTALHYAFISGCDNATICDLIDNGADLFIKNIIDKLPFTDYIFNDAIKLVINIAFNDMLDDVIGEYVIEDNIYLIFQYAKN